jgi:aryl-alcohol dehydrogenase-like predicted oxidoreductase
MKNLFSRRKFLQAAAVTTSAAMFPSIEGCVSGSGNGKHGVIAGELPKRRLGRTNKMVSCIGFGAGSRYCNWVAEDEGAHQKYIDYAIKLGITYFDSARSYGNGVAEERYGLYLTPRYRNQIFLNAKTNQRTYDGVMKEVEISLKTMKTDYFDLYCMHGIYTMDEVNTLSGPNGGYKAFLKLKNEGVAKFIGFSFHVWGEAIKKAFNEFDIDAVLCPINAARYTGCEDNVVSLAQQRDIGLIAIKILGQNSLIGNVNGDDLVRWALRLPISVANVGMDGYSPLESCVNIGKEPLISEAEAREIEVKLNFDPKVTRLPYYTAKN